MAVSRLLERWIPAHERISEQSRVGFALYAGLTLACIAVGIISGYYVLAALPVILLVIGQAVTDFRPLFYLLLFCIPLSTEVELPGGLGTDLPTEPLMVGLMLVYLAYLARHWPRLGGRFFLHPISLLLAAHFAWILLTTVTSDLLLVSVKFSLAKLWYIVTFFLLAGHLIRRPAHIRRFFWLVFPPLLFVIVTSLVRHATYGFSFADQFRTLSPFMRNHVNYSCLLTLFLPWLIYARTWYATGTWRRRLITAAIPVFLLGSYFSYTRAGYIALILAAGVYLTIKWRLTRPLLALGLVAALLGSVYIVRENRYLEFAPNYETTVAHDQFNNLISATYKLEDISTMERVYRWVAAGHMIPARPWLGWGPGNFVNFYQGYTVTSFQTYVSDNPEKSGIHSYFLLMLVEQGVPGLLFFVLLLGGAFVFGERAYHLQPDAECRAILLTTLCSLAVITSFLLINDMIETDKVGSFFFLYLAFLINFGRVGEKEVKE